MKPLLQIVTRTNHVHFKFGQKRFVCQRLGSKEPHPDHLIMAGVLAFSPYFVDGVRFELPASSRMAEALMQTRWNVDLKEQSIEPYSGSVPGLTYSGGVDSTTAAYIMQNGVAVYLSCREGVFFDFARKAIRALEKFGMDTRVVSCDVQTTRTPFGFATDTGVSIPCFVNAAELGLDSVSFGSILESCYGIGRGPFVDYIRSRHFVFWGGLYRAAGLPFNQVTAGLSEVATLDIKNRSGLFGKSCLRSRGECGKCYKCLRRLVTAGKKVELTESLRKQINGRHHFGILEYALYKHGIRCFSTANTLKDMGFLERWYAPSAELLPEKYRNQISERIVSLVGMMDAEDVGRLMSYDPDPQKRIKKTKGRSV